MAEISNGLYHINGGTDILETIDFQNQQQEIVKFINNQIKNPHLNVLIGSGASVNAVPLMAKTMKGILQSDKAIKNEFVTFLDFDSRVDSDACAKAFEKFVNGGELSAAEKVIKSEFDEFANIEAFMTYLQQKASSLRGQDTKTVEQIFNNLKAEFLKSIPKYGKDAYNTKIRTYYVDFYKYIFENRLNESPKLNVFTTNYDLFNEISLEQNNINYSTGFKRGLEPTFDINEFNYRQVDERNRYKDKWQPTNKEANLYKLHGSINWVTRGEEKDIFQENNKAEKSDIKNVVIYPTILKHVETAQISYSPLFRELSMQLQKPNSTLLIIGYGFGDDHINNLILQNLRNPDFNLVIFGDKDGYKLQNIIEDNQYPNMHVIGGVQEGGKAHYFNNIVYNFLAVNGEVENA